MLELTITLGKKTCLLRPTYEALRTIERQLGEGLLSLARKLTDREMTLDQMMSIFSACIEAVPGQEFSDEMTGEAMESGLQNLYEKLAELFTMILSGNAPSGPIPDKHELKKLADLFPDAIPF